MIYGPASEGSAPQIIQPGRDRGKIILTVLFVSFLAGALAGSLLGTYSYPEDAGLLAARIAANIADIPLAYIIIGCAGLHLMVFFFSTTMFGLLLIPAVSALYGGLIGFVSAAFLVGFSWKGLAFSSAVLILPSVFSVPGFFLIGSDGLSAASRLLSFSLGRHTVRSVTGTLKHALLTVGLIGISVIVTALLVPAILKSVP